MIHLSNYFFFSDGTYFAPPFAHAPPTAANFPVTRLCRTVGYHLVYEQRPELLPVKCPEIDALL